MIKSRVAIRQTRCRVDVEVLVNQLTRRTTELEALRTVGRDVSSSLPLNTILDHVLDITLTVMEMEAGEICLLDAARGEVRLARHRGLSREAFLERTRFAVGEGIPGLVAQTGEVVAISDLEKDRRFLRRTVVAAGFKTFIAVPLTAKGETVGSLDIAARQACRFTETDIRLLTTIGAAVGMAASDACLYGNLRLATKRLEAKLEELQRTQDHLVATEQLRAMGQMAADVPHDIHKVLMALRARSSFN